MTLTAVLWLQSGRLFEQREIMDRAGPPVELWHNMLKERSVCWRPEPILSARVDVMTLTFQLTDPEFARITYRAGRRRFHYRETTGWRPREELEGSLCRDRDARFERIVSALDQHHALMAAGAFPVHTCALPKDWAAAVTIAPVYGVQGLDASQITHTWVHLKINPKLGLE